MVVFSPMFFESFRSTPANRAAFGEVSCLSICISKHLYFSAHPWGQTMLRIDSPQDADFRTEVAAWLQENIPEHLRHVTFRPNPAEGMPWYRKLAARG